MPRLFLYLIIVLFPNQNIIAKVAEKAKRVAVTDQTISNVFCEKSFLPFDFFFRKISLRYLPVVLLQE